MNFDKWPRVWKKQYNEEIRKRLLLARKKAEKEKILDERYCPTLWKFPLSEVTVFTMFAYVFPFNDTVVKILRNFFPQEKTKVLLVSSKYLFYSRKIFPGYYSDRERIVMMLNRYKATGDIEDFLKWIPFHSDKQSTHLIDVMIGIFFLDQYLNDLHREDYLLIAISYLQRANSKFKCHEARQAFASLIAFCHYMNQEFDVSETYLKAEGEGEFQGRFLTLLKDVA